MLTAAAGPCLAFFRPLCTCSTSLRACRGSCSGARALPHRASPLWMKPHLHMPKHSPSGTAQPDEAGQGAAGSWGCRAGGGGTDRQRAALKPGVAASQPGAAALPRPLGGRALPVCFSWSSRRLPLPLGQTEAPHGPCDCVETGDGSELGTVRCGSAISFAFNGEKIKYVEATLPPRAVQLGAINVSCKLPARPSPCGFGCPGTLGCPEQGCSSSER